ncbi:MAG: DUF1573 domain-containing protein [Coraliomargarita sp.]
MPTVRKIALLSLISWIAGLSALQASVLVWDRTEARIEMKPHEAEVRATFTVTNEGDETLRIADIKASCGCTGSVIDRRILKPGQATSIEAVFNKGKRKGKNHIKLEVFLDSQADSIATLHMIVDVPELVTTQPRIVFWNEKTAKSARSIRVNVDERYVDPEKVKIQYDETLFKLSREDDPSGKSDFIIKLEPLDFGTKTRHSIEITAKGLKNNPDGEGKIHAFVQ